MLEKADPVIAERMMEEFKARMAEAPEKCGCAPGEYGCTVLLTAQGNLCSTVFPFATEKERVEEERLLERLAQKGDTEVAYILCLPGLVPPWWLLELLPALDQRNLETRVLLPQEGGPRYRTIRACQPPKK